MLTSLLSQHCDSEELYKLNANEFRDFIREFFSERAIPANLDKPFQENYFCAFYGMNDRSDADAYFISKIDRSEHSVIAKENRKEYAFGILDKALELHYDKVICIFDDGIMQVFTRETPIVLN